MKSRRLKIIMGDQLDDVLVFDRDRLIDRTVFGLFDFFIDFTFPAEGAGAPRSNPSVLKSSSISGQ